MSKTDENVAQIKGTVHGNRNMTICGLDNQCDLIWMMQQHFDTRSEHTTD
jgi:hypothetical protein